LDIESVKSDIDRVVITEADLQGRLKELADQVTKDYEGRDLLMIGVLKGAAIAMADMARLINRHVEMDWMAVSSYGAGTKSSGVVRILKDLDQDVTGREILIVEDILDTGLTLSWLKGNLESRGAKNVDILTVLRKPEATKIDVYAKYIGFDIPNEFVVGYGLDYNERYRNLPFIAVLAKHLYS
jgi:hypoxanthine phosphoribosyltransferase